MGDRQERRKHKRIHCDETITVTVVACADRPELKGESVSCNTRDVSSTGFRLRLGMELPPGCRLKLYIEARRARRSFDLEGDVAWVAPGSTEDVYVVGVLLRDKPRREMKAWREFVVESIRFNDPFA